jgi:amicoumacin kinase
MTRPLFDANQVLGAALELWDARGPIEIVSDRDNLVCAVTGHGGPLALRLTHSDRRPFEQVDAEMGFVDYLGRLGAPVAAPLRSRAGRLVERVEAHHGYFSACLLGWARGQRMTYRSSLWSEALVAEWGRTLGRIHVLSRGYESPEEPRRFSWREDDVWANALAYLPPREAVAREKRLELQPRLERLPQSGEDFGLIHGDLGSANFHVDGQSLTVYDFDDCCYHWYAYDVVVSLWAYRLLGPDERQRHANVWLEGYHSVRELDAAWLRSLDLFFELRALYLLARSHRDAAADGARVGVRERRARNGWRRMLEEGFTW